jgi:hypothetical protein
VAGGFVVACLVLCIAVLVRCRCSLFALSSELGSANQLVLVSGVLVLTPGAIGQPGRGGGGEGGELP